MGNCECVSSKISTVNNDFSGFPSQVTTTVGFKIHFIRIPLSQKDIKNLQESWIDIKQIWIKICATAFQRWFSTYPEIKEMFSFEYDNVDETSIKSSPALYSHVQKFECLIEKVLNDAENKSKFVETLINLGKFHYELGAQQKFATALGSSLSYATCININENDLMTKNAWDTFFRFMTGNVRLGIRMKLMENSTQI
ncbi:uncharacterized protein LOC105848003 isoform X2 [Hydra vulgaris]|uniref:Uncharacterized protein LOC105848003 isoform X2 n=1 Tax=Hydra vulgaris TaxID=6087 RepID=A0ABM4BQL2_HYDVU